MSKPTFVVGDGLAVLAEMIRAEFAAAHGRLSKAGDVDLSPGEKPPVRPFVEFRHPDGLSHEKAQYRYVVPCAGILARKAILMDLSPDQALLVVDEEKRTDGSWVSVELRRVA